MPGDRRHGVLRGGAHRGDRREDRRGENVPENATLGPRRSPRHTESSTTITAVCTAVVTARPRSRWLRRIAIALALSVATLLAIVTPASADPEDLHGNSGQWGGPGAKMEDSRGLPVWVFDLYIDDGDATSPGQVVAAGLARLGWGIYRAIVAAAIWLVDWVLSFDWLAGLTAPIREIADAIDLIIIRFGLTATLLTITAFVAGIWMLKGAWSLGIYELVVSLALAALAVGVLNDPVDMVAGDDGYIVRSAQIGMQLSDGVVNGPDFDKPPKCSPGAPCPVTAEADDGALGSGFSPADGDLRTQQAENLVNVFIRMPQQAVNFGQIIDGTKCEDEYDDWMESEVSGNTADRGHTITDFAECNPDAIAVADSPDMGLVITSAAITPGAVIILLFAALIAGVVMWCALWVLFQSVKAIVALVVALLPGNSRNVFWSTIAEVLVWLAMLIFSLLFLAVYLVVVSEIMTAQQDMGTLAMFLIVDIILLLGLIAFWRARASLAGVAGRLAKTLGSRPGRKPTTMLAVMKQPAPPDPMGDTVRRTTQSTRSTVGKIWRKVRGKSSSPFAPPSGAAPTRAPATHVNVPSRPSGHSFQARQPRAARANTPAAPTRDTHTARVATSRASANPARAVRTPTASQQPAREHVHSYRAARRTALRNRLNRAGRRRTKRT